jgi:hypothetical protein
MVTLLLNVHTVRQHPSSPCAFCVLFAPFLGSPQATRRRSKILARKMRGSGAIIQQDQYSSKQPTGISKSTILWLDKPQEDAEGSPQSLMNNEC